MPVDSDYIYNIMGHYTSFPFIPSLCSVLQFSFTLHVLGVSVPPCLRHSVCVWMDVGVADDFWCSMYVRS